MPQKGIILRALIASPGDLHEERKIIPEVISTWNATHSLTRGAIIEPVLWESHSVPLQEGRPQGIINEQLGSHCDFLIGLFWTKLGTNTGVAASGTVEEIQEFRAAGKPVLLYFSKQLVHLDKVDKKQYSKLEKFKAEMRSQGLQHDYTSVPELRADLLRHIDGVVNKLLKQEGWSGDIAPIVNTESDYFKSHFEDLVRSVSTAWEVERDSTPRDLIGGMSILGLLVGELIKLASLPGNQVPPKTRVQLMDVIKTGKKLQQHRVFLDGGKSWDQYWTNGTSLMQELETIRSTL